MKKTIAILLSALVILMMPLSAYATEEIVVHSTESYTVTVPEDGKPYYTGETPPFSVLDTLYCTSPKDYSNYVCSGIQRDYLDTTKYGWNTMDTSVRLVVSNTDNGWGHDTVDVHNGYVKANWTGGNLITPTSIMVKPEHVIEGSGITCSIGLPAGVSCGQAPNSAVFTWPQMQVNNTSGATYNTTSWDYDNDDTILSVSAKGNVTWVFGTQGYGQMKIVKMSIDQ